MCHVSINHFGQQIQQDTSASHSLTNTNVKESQRGSKSIYSKAFYLVQSDSEDFS